jgi:heterodisulfide reductase subunit C
MANRQPQWNEKEYQQHLREEGPGPVNEHPEGCYHCGSIWHKSTDCPEARNNGYYESFE